nr:hybrid signal transduction histidine kinase M [Tanacetum cinerariifolium]
MQYGVSLGLRYGVLTTCTDLAVKKSTICWIRRIKKLGYAVLGRHFVDSNWRLQKRVLSFIHLPPPRRGTDIADNLYKCFIYWSIENKVFTISVDNASNNDKAIKNLTEIFSRIKKLPCGGSLGLKSHVEDDTASTNPDWCQLDDLIKMYSRAINLDNKLRSIKIGTMTINEYCTKIRSMADLLKNLGCDVSDKNLVMYTVNGLDSHFATLVDIIRHRKTLPSFETTRTMLLLKESSFKDNTRTSSTFDGSSSSPTALVTST